MPQINLVVFNLMVAAGSGLLLKLLLKSFAVVVIV